MKFGIGAKLVVVATALVCVTSALLLWSMVTGSRDIVLAHEVLDLGDETRLRAWELLSEIYSVRSDVDVGIGRNLTVRELQTRAPTDADRTNLETFCRENIYQPNYLWVEIIAIDGAGSETSIVGLNKPAEPPAGFLPATLIGNRERFLEQVKAYGRQPDAEAQPIVSEIDRVAVTYAGSQPPKMTNLVWAGLYLKKRDPNGSDIVVIAAQNLDAKPPRGLTDIAQDDRSPLSRMNGSPRHFSVIANEPQRPADAAGATAVGTTRQTGDETTDRLVFPYDEEFQLLPPKELGAAFGELYRNRDKLIENCRQLKPELEPRDVLAAPQRIIDLQQPVYFLQSSAVPQEQHAAAAAAVAQLAPTLPGGQRIGLLFDGVKNIRLLALSRQEAVALAKKVDQRLKAASDGSSVITVDWQQPVECDDCYVRFVLFPVRSADAVGGRRYYGLAQAAFRDEMAADVWDKLYRLIPWGIVVVGLAAGLAFACSLFFTRPLKQITTAAQEVADANVHIDPAESTWRKSVTTIVEQLPVHRRDEIGVLARAFQQMLGEVVEGHERLRQWNIKLDHRVQERTQELQEANEELKAARDKAHELNRAKDAFLASVSHELRNPLNQVSGFCQLLELTDLDDEQRGDVEKIRLAGSQLLALINDILDYQKIIMGGITLEPEKIRVEKLVDDIRAAMAFQARDNRNQLEVECDDQLDTLYADEQRVRQVLLNLVGNACKLTLDGTVRLRASLDREDDRQVVRFDVIDTGRGMTADERAKLFTPFTKLSAKQGNRSGTGLGLVICKGFCDMMHGHIGVQSTFGKGSTFTVRLPVDTTRGPAVGPIPGTEAAAAEPAPEPPAVEFGPPQQDEPAPAKPGLIKHPWPAGKAPQQLPKDTARVVLVVDDEPGAREMMQRYLETQGFRVVTAGSGLEGLEMAKRIRPAAITLDAVMPGLDGWAVLAALRTDEETKDIPVIMVTISDDEQRGYSLGAAEFVAKPVNWDKLTHVLSGFTGNKRDRSVLVVDDEPEAREILRRNLERDGWKVFEAEHGQAALELLASENPAAILLDLMMPVMDGFEFLAQYCQLAEWLSIPVVVITAKDPTPEELEQLDGLVVRVLRKGQYSHEDLLKEIHRRVDKHLTANASDMKEQRDAQNSGG